MSMKLTPSLKRLAALLLTASVGFAGEAGFNQDERFADADRRERAAATIADREAAEAERQEAAGEFWGAGQELADLLLLLLRYGLEHRREALAQYLADALRPELAPLAQALAALEDRSNG